MPRQLRQLFASILVYCQPANIRDLWEKYLDDLIEDFFRKTNDKKLSIAKALIEINDFLHQNGVTITDFSELPEIEYSLLEIDQLDSLIIEEQNYDQDKIDQTLLNLVKLNSDQKLIFDTIIKAINNEINQNLFFIDGPGGTGKTFLYNILLAHIRSSKSGMNGIAIAVASSGIAALLISGGRTAHSRFIIPLIPHESTTLNILKQSKLANLILTAIILILGSDFRQVLPVVVRDTCEQVVDACLKSSDLWKHFQSLKLSINMRVQQQNNIEQKNFVDFLLRVGEGKEPIHLDIGDDIIKLPDDIVLDSENIKDLISEVFNDINSNYKNNDYLRDRAILTTKNVDVEEINQQILEIIPGENYEFLSADSVEDEAQVDQSLYPIEFLNTLTPSGTPPHKLVLKKDAPIILLRNLSTSEGLCNGTRLIVKNCHTNVIDAEILTGINQGTRVFIPRIRLQPSDADLPFTLIRRQFPIKLSFAMTINKAQGQTITKMGLYLPKPVFTHGQLYVALSRVQSKDNIKVLVKNGHIEGKDGVYTKNIVYKEVFTM